MIQIKVNQYVNILAAHQNRKQNRWNTDIFFLC